MGLLIGGGLFGQETNILDKMDVQAGEARRNKNVVITALDNNAQKDANTRLGTTATPITEFTSELKYFGAEFGLKPSSGLHLAALHLVPGRRPKAMHGNRQWTLANSALAARSFFQLDDVLPARQNIVSGRVEAPLWRGTILALEGAHDTRSGFVNGNALVPLAAERSCLATDTAVCAVINRFFRAWPTLAPNRPDIEVRALHSNAPQSIDTTSTTARLNQTLKDHRFSGRHTWANQQVDAFQLIAGQNPDTTTKSHDARLTWTYQESQAAPDADRLRRTVTRC